jgi:hypothetical protein
VQILRFFEEKSQFFAIFAEKIKNFGRLRRPGRGVNQNFRQGGGDVTKYGLVRGGGKIWTARGGGSPPPPPPYAELCARGENN